MTDWEARWHKKKGFNDSRSYKVVPKVFRIGNFRDICCRELASLFDDNAVKRLRLNCFSTRDIKIHRILKDVRFSLSSIEIQQTNLLRLRIGYLNAIHRSFPFLNVFSTNRLIYFRNSIFHKDFFPHQISQSQRAKSVTLVRNLIVKCNFRRI